MSNRETPTVGRIVHYQLTKQDAEQINRRRTSAPSIRARIDDNAWPIGAQAHIGNAVSEGDIFPAIVVRVWPEDRVNAQVFLDGNDTFWATSKAPGPDPGEWAWPPRA